MATRALVLLVGAAMLGGGGGEMVGECSAGDASCSNPPPAPSLLPVYDAVAPGSTTAVCVVSKESELPGLRIALLTILLLQPQMKVQLFAFDYVEEALADALSRIVSLLAPDGRWRACPVLCVPVRAREGG